jgi:hypothetical protein
MVGFISINNVSVIFQASPITIGGRKAVVEIKRTTTRGNWEAISI